MQKEDVREDISHSALTGGIIMSVRSNMEKNSSVMSVHLISG